MTWQNAFDIGPCTVNVCLNGRGTPATPSQLTAAGISVDTTGGVVTVSWNGHGDSPNGVMAEVVPSYPINGATYQAENPLVADPASSGSLTVDGNPDGNFSSNPMPNPWVAPDAPTASFGMTTRFNF
ncbi:MAG: hypothetical protein WA777_12660 [Rhodanobacter sp.]